MPETIQQLDQTILWWIAEHMRIPALNPLVSLYTALGNGGLLFITLAVGMLLFKSTRRAGAAALTAMGLGALAVNLILKPLVARPRPWVVMAGFDTLLRSGDPNSFPSGHTCAAFAFAAAAAVSLPRKWVRAAALTAAALMGFSRLYVGVHFPTDVLAGAAIGICCGLLAGWLAPRVSRWVTSRRSDQK